MCVARHAGGVGQPGRLAAGEPCRLALPVAFSIWAVRGLRRAEAAG